MDTTYDAYGNYTQYGFDGASRVKSVSNTVTNVQYTYDPRGNRLTVAANYNGQITTFTYDPANRLLSETTPPAFNGVPIVTSYTYDAAGNRQTKVDGKGQTTTYGYDANRRLKTVHASSGRG